MKSKLTTIPQLTLEHKQRSLVTSIQSPENAWDTLKKKKRKTTSDSGRYTIDL